MTKVSVIIPSRNEMFLQKTVADLLVKATGDIEVIAVLDGYWPVPPLTEDKRLIQLHRGTALGLRAGVNAAASVARGEYLMKCDGHCMFGEGWDEILKADCEDNWVVVPRRFSLDAENWKPQKEPIDYEHIFFPHAHPDDLGLHARPWMERSRDRKDILIDEDMSFQGYSWFMSMKHFKRLGGLSEEGYLTFMGEPQEIHFKTQLGSSEGKLMRNKKTWFAHLHKGKQYGRGYHMAQSERINGNAYSFDFWWNNRWTERVHDIDWLFEKFWPIPSWPENWREISGYA